jgi:tetratricopeptide (TPR) repeat protein
VRFSALAALPALAVQAAAVLGLACCVPAPAVERAYGDHSVDGRYVEPSAYAAFLRGALAEASGDAKGALASYEAATNEDPRSPEIWTRIGALRCRTRPGDPGAAEALRKATELDAGFARAWAAKASCARLRGDEAGAREAAARAASVDPTADEATAMILGSAASTVDRRTRSALVALTLTAQDRVLAWETLARWAEAHHDVALWVRALGELARISPGGRATAARAAEALSAAGDVAEARSLAVSAVAAVDRPLDALEYPIAARLAVDQAIAERDGGAARAWATRTRLTLEEVAGRALLAGDAGLAKDLASEVARADPEALGARLIVAASDRRDIAGAVPRSGEANGTRVSAATLVAFGSALAYAVTPEETRSALARIPHGAVIPGDLTVTSRAAELVARGACPKDLLPPAH